MKKRLFACHMLILALLTGSVPFAVPLFADDIAVPDIESRIRNSGSSIPESAVPPLAVPAPVALPSPPPAPVTPPTPAPAVPAVPVPPAALPAPAAASPVAASAPLLSGFASLGAGSPNALRGELSLLRSSGEIPGFELGFLYNAADGYGKESAGNGYFDRESKLSARIFSINGTKDWSAAVHISDNSDGFQGKNPDYYSLTRRDVSWDAGTHGIPFAIADLTASLDFSGSVFTRFADRPGSGTAPVNQIPDYSGYFMSPRATFAWSAGSFSSKLAFSYGYETVADGGEFQNGTGDLSLHYGIRDFALDGGVGLLADSSDGLLAPFSLALSYANAKTLVRAVHFSGGLSADRVSPVSLAATEPFAALSGTSAYSADWTGSGSITLAPAEAVSITGDAVFRTTAFDRKTLVLAGSTDSSTGLVPLVYTSRDSLVTKSSLVWNGTGHTVSAGYSGEWLDRLWRRTLHSLNAALTVFDTGTSRIWEAGLASSFPLDSAELPRLDMHGTVRPVRNLALTLSLDDPLPLITGTDRTRNGIYSERCGSLMLSGRMDF